MNDILSTIRVADTKIKPAVRKALMAKYGDDVTLATVANIPKADLLAMDGIGKGGLQSCVDAIGAAYEKPETVATIAPQYVGPPVIGRETNTHGWTFGGIESIEILDHTDTHSTLRTRDLPDTLTAHELAQIIDLTLKLPDSIVQEHFRAVAHYFKPCDAAEKGTDNAICPDTQYAE